MPSSEPKFKNRVLLSDAEFFCESNGVTKNVYFISLFFSFGPDTFKGVKQVTKMEIKKLIPRCKLDCHFPPLCQFSALQLSSSGQGTVYGEKKNKGNKISTGPLYNSIVGTVKI